MLLQFASIAQGLGVSPLNPHFGTRGEACCQCIHEQTKIVKGKFVKVVRQIWHVKSHRSLSKQSMHVQPPSPPELCYVYPCIPGPELPWPNIGNRVDRMCFDVMPPGVTPFSSCPMLFAVCTHCSPPPFPPTERRAICEGAERARHCSKPHRRCKSVFRV